MAIATTANYKTYAGITASTWDAQLGVIIPAVQAEMERYCGRVFDTASYTEYHDGCFANQLVLKNTPITALTSVALVGTDGTESTVDSTTYTYDADSGVVSFKRVSRGLVTVDDWGYPENYGSGESPNFGAGFRNVKVVYTAGYSSGTMPADLKMALYRLVDSAFKNVGQDRTLRSETLGSYSYTAGGGDGYTDLLVSVCAPFRRTWAI